MVLDESALMFKNKEEVAAVEDFYREYHKFMETQNRSNIIMRQSLSPDKPT